MCTAADAADTALLKKPIPLTPHLRPHGYTYSLVRGRGKPFPLTPYLRPHGYAYSLVRGRGKPFPLTPYRRHALVVNLGFRVEGVGCRARPPTCATHW